MTTIQARPPYSPPAAPKDYNGAWLRTQLALIARALTPTTGRTLVAAGTIAATDNVIYCDATSAPFTVDLLPANQVQYLTVTLLKTDASANAVTIGGTVSGVVNPALASQYDSQTITNNGVNWYTIASV